MCLGVQFIDGVEVLMCRSAQNMVIRALIWRPPLSLSIHDAPEKTCPRNKADSHACGQMFDVPLRQWGVKGCLFMRPM